jgi:hypothetical protein
MFPRVEYAAHERVLARGNEVGGGATAGGGGGERAAKMRERVEKRQGESEESRKIERSYRRNEMEMEIK